MRTRRPAWTAGRLLALLLCAAAALALLPAIAGADTVPQVAVSGNELESGGSPLQLRGVSRDAYETCTGNAVYDATFANAPEDDPDDDFADGPVNQWSIDVMKSWGINTVRLPLNESCWLGSPAPTEQEMYAPYAVETAADYRREVENYVNLLSQNGLYVILVLQYTAPSAAIMADQIDHFPDAADAPTFWSQIAGTFGSDPNVLFDLSGEIGASPYNGPDYSAGTYNPSGHADGTQWTDDDIWNCWLNGCSDVPSSYESNGTPITYDTAGMDQLITAVRTVDATTPVIVASPDFALGYEEDDCGAGANQGCWDTYHPSDAHMVVDAHLYDHALTNIPAGSDGLADPAAGQESSLGLQAQGYITTYLQPIAASHPVMLGEVGETDCQTVGAPFLSDVLNEVDLLGDGISVVAWTWDANTDESNQIASGWGCPTDPQGAGGPLVISDYNGAATAMGQVFETWLQSHDPGHPAPPPAPGTSTTTATTPTSTTPSTTTTTPPTSSTQTGSTTTAPAALAPVASAAPHLSVSGPDLVCGAGSFLHATGATITYSWLNAATGRRIAGPARANRLAGAKGAEQPVDCEETVTLAGHSASATSKTLPVPGKLSGPPAGPLALPVICPASEPRGCQVSLALRSRAKHPVLLGQSTLTLKAGRRASASVKLSAAARRLLRREHALAAELTVTETVAGTRQTIAVTQLKLR